MKYPEVLYPTILEGKVYGPLLRLESLDQTELYLKPSETHTWKGDHFNLKNYGPIEINGKTWGVAHQQKVSTRGWLKVSPQCYHWWYFWKIQEYSQNPDGGSSWKPGTEKGIYFRKPFSWRWDVAGSMVDGILRHWIWTKGYLGGRWD